MVRLYEVGGSIRDEFLGLKSPDLDYVATCPKGWAGLVEWAEKHLDRIFLKTPEYFTIRGLRGKDAIDIVLARKDGAYSDGRHPDEVEPGTLEDDLARRDFTMNAIARCVETGELFDPFNGREDIENRLIRCVGNTADRITEDALRLLRAIRFAVTKDFTLSPELMGMIFSTPIFDTFHNTWKTSPHPRTSQKMAALLGAVKRDRVRVELDKMFRFDSLASMAILQDIDPLVRRVIIGSDIWLKPTVEKR